MTLNELPVGSSCLVKKISGEGKIRRRIFDMGITPGAEIYLEVTLRGYELSLRKSEASFVEVEELEEGSK